MGKTDISVIIVNYNTGTFLAKCLRSVIAAVAGVKSEIFVVDNASSDDSLKSIEKLFPSVTFISLDQNLGFARANNIAIRKSKGNVILLLNPDTEIAKNSIISTMQLMKKDEKVGIATCKVLLPSGKLDPASHRGFPTPWNSLTYFLKLEKVFPHLKWFGGYHQTYKDFSLPHEIDSPSGAFFMIKRAVVDQIGLLDESYFMYAEDIDWAYRAREKGWKAMYYPASSVIHHKGISSGIKSHSVKISASELATRRRSIEAFYDTMLLFYKKHFQKRYPFLVNWVVKGTIYFKKRIALVTLSV